ncbi:MAG: hypothetical protein ACTTJF_08810 [Campylobacter sp.]|uniref:hypothetical protein n=1 Tax=Campylobacter sp. TaxID=205 RepID=UPI003F9F3BF7
MAANLKVKMLETDNEANKSIFFYDQDSQDFKITLTATTTHYKLQNISISQVDFDNVYLEAKEPKCEAESNPYKKELLNDKDVSDKKAAEYEKVITIKDIIKIKRI